MPTLRRSYPAQYARQGWLRDGTDVYVRPIRPSDETAMVKFHHTLSDETVYLRYFGFLDLERRIAHERLCMVCSADYDEQMALVGELGNAEIIGVGRIAKSEDRACGEIGVVISDAYQRHGLGSLLLDGLLRFAEDERLACVTAELLPENVPMQKLLRKHGFRFQPDSTGEFIIGSRMVEA